MGLFSSLTEALAAGYQGEVNAGSNGQRGRRIFRNESLVSSLSVGPAVSISKMPAAYRP